jgi:hypothetical protein
VGEREIMEIFLNVATKNTPVLDIYIHGTNMLLAGIRSKRAQCNVNVVQTAA